MTGRDDGPHRNGPDGDGGDGGDGDGRDGDGPHHDGATTHPAGTPVAVQFAADPATRRALARFTAGPTIWFVHFMTVYLVAEAGCTGSGPGLSLFAPPVPRVVTIVATVIAVGACVALAVAELRRWRQGRALAARPGLGEPDIGDDRPGGPMAWAGVLLAVVSAMAVLFVAAPALVLTAC